VEVRDEASKTNLGCVWLFLGLAVPQATADDCDSCDCIHLPCPPDCKPCCGLLKGKIVSKSSDMFALKSPDGSSSKFKIGPETKIVGDIEEGRLATVYFRKSATGKLAQKVISEENK
jgi:hypothetical protein